MLSSSSDQPSATRSPLMDAALTENVADMTTPGVIVVMDTAEAEAMGAFREVAITEAEAWEANADLEADGTRGG